MKTSAVLVAMLFFALVASCQPPPRTRCVPGLVVSCACENGASGVQTCSSLGSFGLCTCDPNSGFDAGSDAADAVVDAPSELHGGWIDLGPNGLALVPGQTALLTAVVRDALGVEVRPAPSLTFASRDPSVLTVDASGTVHAVSAGRVIVTASDASYGDARLIIDVVPAPRTGPVGFTCAPGRIHVTVGESTTPHVEFTDAAGRTVTDPSIHLTLSSDAARVDSAGAVTGVHEGMTWLGAETSDGEALTGACPVLVRDAPAGPVATCTHPPWLGTYCWLAEAPVRFSDSALTSPIRVVVDHWYTIGGCDQQIDEGIRAPDDLRVHTPGVVQVWGTETLEPLAPGRTTIEAFYAGVSCGQFTTEVEMDTGGFWQVSCANGDVGSFEMPNEPDWIEIATCVGPPGCRDSVTVHDVPNETDGCFANPTDNHFYCWNRVRWTGRLNDARDNVLCSAGGCYGWAVESCDSERNAHGLPRILGPREFESGGCHYTSGSVDCPLPPIPSYLNFTVQSQSYSWDGSHFPPDEPSVSCTSMSVGGAASLYSSLDLRVDRPIDGVGMYRLRGGRDGSEFQGRLCNDSDPTVCSLISYWRTPDDPLECPNAIRRLWVDSYEDLGVLRVIRGSFQLDLTDSSCMGYGSAVSPSVQGTFGCSFMF